MGAEQLTIEVLGRLNEGGDIVATQDTICIEFARLLLIMTQLQTYLVFFVKSVSLESVDDGCGLNVAFKVNVAEGTIDP